MIYLFINLFKLANFGVKMRFTLYEIKKNKNNELFNT